jgi:D-tyrosyl-tRNA(Tyr) deacylase
MRALLQRVRRASVSVDGTEIARVDRGLLVLLGVAASDTDATTRQMAEKTVRLRMFEDAAGKTNLSALDVSAGILVVSQFTLYADTRRGRRPGFTDAAPPDHAQPLVDLFEAEVRGHGLYVATGRFGAHMVVALENDGPFTLMLEL